MRNIFMFLVVLMILIPSSFCFAGEIRTTPQDIVLVNPTTNQVNLIELVFKYGSNPSAIIRFEILDSTGRSYIKHNVFIRNKQDDPATTGVDESTTDFTDFVAGYGTLLYTRGDAAIWAYIQNRYVTQ